MNDKRLQIIEAAIKCFAQKGFHATSIQEITDMAGIAKGSLYFYFKSKDELLLSACQYYLDRMNKQSDLILEDRSEPPRDRLYKLLKLQFEQLVKHRDFIIMLMNEQGVQTSSEMHKWVYAVRAQTLYRSWRLIGEIYGEKGRPYALDGAASLNGLFGEYTSYIILNRKDLAFDALVRHMLGCLDDMMQGMGVRGAAPILTEDGLREELEIGREGVESSRLRQREPVMRIRMAARSLAIPEEKLATLHAGLAAIEEELARMDPKRIVMISILTYLRTLGIPELLEAMDDLEAQL